MIIEPAEKTDAVPERAIVLGSLVSVLDAIVAPTVPEVALQVINHLLFFGLVYDRNDHNLTIFKVHVFRLKIGHLVGSPHTRNQLDDFVGLNIRVVALRRLELVFNSVQFEKVDLLTTNRSASAEFELLAKKLIEVGSPARSAGYCRRW